MLVDHSVPETTVCSPTGLGLSVLGLVCIASLDLGLESMS